LSGVPSGLVDAKPPSQPSSFVVYQRHTSAPVSASSAARKALRPRLASIHAWPTSVPAAMLALTKSSSNRFASKPVDPTITLPSRTSGAARNWKSTSGVLAPAGTSAAAP
jgi:hypothetical protein